jgi:hydroxyethylthiazole kinase
VRGNPAETAALAGIDAQIRGVESIGAAAEGAELARGAARELATTVSVTGVTDFVSDGERTLAVRNGDALLATITGSGCMSSTMTGCFFAIERSVDAGAAALAAFGVAGEDAAREARGPGTFHATLYDALYNLTPETLDERARIAEA